MGLFFSFLRSLVAARKKPTAATVDSATAPFALWFFCFPRPAPRVLLFVDAGPREGASGSRFCGLFVI